MAISPTVIYAALGDFYLDPNNPRLGRHNIAKALTQDDILALMEDWALDELAVSFIENGFWVQEALVVVKEKIKGKERLVVVEGNRRLAALLLLQRAKAGKPHSPKWAEIAKSTKRSLADLFAKIPYIQAETRKEIQAYLGFRHVSGIKEWAPAEKAQFIAHLIDSEGLTYQQVRRRIGSRTDVVRQNYISYRLLLQMEDLHGEIDIDSVEERFSVLHLSLRTAGTQAFLDIDIQAEPGKAVKPVPKKKLKQLAQFALWLFGDDQRLPLVKDSRQVDDFGKILQSPKAIEYLERTEAPVFETAFRIAGGDEAETISSVLQAADKLEDALGTAHHFKKSRELADAVKRVSLDALRLLELFPEVRKQVLEGKS